MRPDKAESDSSVMYRVQKWLDEQKEFEALGVERLGPSYQITGLKCICTPNVLYEVESEERQARREGLGDWAIYNRVLQVA